MRRRRRFRPGPFEVVVLALVLLVGVSELAHCQDDEAPTVLIAASLVGAHSLDVYTTLRVKRLGGFETNPLIGDSNGLMFAVKGAYVALATLAVTKLWKENKALALLVWAGCFAWGVVPAWRNFEQERRR